MLRAAGERLDVSCGQRRPTLGLLLQLAWAYRVPLDDLVGAPDVGDPRIWLRPRRVQERTVVPLTSEGSVQAWKIFIPAGLSEPRLRSHEGTEWLWRTVGKATCHRRGRRLCTRGR